MHGIAPLLACSFFLCACSGPSGSQQHPCVAGEMKHIGVLWQSTEKESLPEGNRKALDWALENVNAYAQQTGICLQAVVRTVENADPESLKAVAKELAADDGNQAVMGLTDSSQAMDVSEIFLKAKKPFVTPLATAAEFVRVIENEPQQTKFVWRTVGSDVMRARAMVEWIASKGWFRVALVAPRKNKILSVAPLQTVQTGGYGDTYAHWLEMFAQAFSIQFTWLQNTNIPSSRQSCAALVNTLGDVDVLVVATASPQDTACIVGAAREVDGSIPVLVTEALDPLLSSPGFLQHHSMAKSALYSITPTAAVASGFAHDYQQRFGQKLPAYAAQTYDALLWIFYGLIQKAATSHSSAKNSSAASGFQETQRVGEVSPLFFFPQSSSSLSGDPLPKTSAISKPPGGCSPLFPKVPLDSTQFKGPHCVGLHPEVTINSEHFKETQSGLAGAMHKNAQRQRRATSTPVHWGKAGIGQAIQAIQTGQPVQFGGAAGPLIFDPDLDMDPTTASYRLNRVDGDSVVSQDVLTVRMADDGDLAVTSLLAREHNAGFAEKTQCPTLPPLVNKNTRVLLLASSYGWRNYRHQSDLLAVRNWLLEHGANEKYMVTIAADDLAKHPQNPDLGSVINRTNGINLHQADGINYRLCGDKTSCSHGVTVADVLRILAGNPVEEKCLREPCAIGHASEQNGGSARSEKYDLFIYLVGHAGETGLYLNQATPCGGLLPAVTTNSKHPERPPHCVGGCAPLLFSPESSSILSGDPSLPKASINSKYSERPQGAKNKEVLHPEDLTDVLQALSARRVFLAVDTCHAGAFGEEVLRRALPNIVVFSATRKEEVSFSEFFDPRLHTPLGNQFTARWLDVLQRTPAAPLPSMLWQVSRGTLGSHAELYNALNFENLACTRLARPSFGIR